MDSCFCQPDNDQCHGHDQTTTPSIEETESEKNKYEKMFCNFLKRKCFVLFCFVFLRDSHVDNLLPTSNDADHRSTHSGELKLGLYDLTQQRLVENGGSISIGDRLFIEVKYRAGSI